MLEPHGQIGNEKMFCALRNPRRDTPWQKFRIALNIGNQVKQLLAAIGKGMMFAQVRHKVWK